ncbi:MAG: ParA family protein [Firmicutes bacterium]|nr:ParA family protein [Bacillota bacterium]
MDELRTTAIKKWVKGTTVLLSDRLLTGAQWTTVAQEEPSRGRGTRRITLFSLKGGVGRTTTTAVLATHLARKGTRVLLFDLDLESPGVSSALLEPEERPEWGIVDWFVEDLVGQGEDVLRSIASEPRWAQDFSGGIWIVPAYGQKPREYLAKLGRVYLDRPPLASAEGPETWTSRLQRLVRALEDVYEPDIVLLDSRSGLHDLAAAVVTDLQADVLLFAVDSDATWTGYRILFQHWADFGRIRDIREKLWMVAALIPDQGRDVYLRRFRERAWELFREVLYDEVPAEPPDQAAGDWFSFDLLDEDAPHNPLPIYWTAGLNALTDLRNLEDAPVRQAYYAFFERFERLWPPLGGGHDDGFAPALRSS